jgi:hypothetical protein
MKRQVEERRGDGKTGNASMILRFKGGLLDPHLDLSDGSIGPRDAEDLSIEEVDPIELIVVAPI